VKEKVTGLKLRLILVVLTLLAAASTLADVKFYNVNDIYGISFREAASVCKDNDGFIWASSKIGVLRISSDYYNIYQLPFETSDVINVKLVYNNSNLLAYSNNGQIFKYNAIYDRFDRLFNAGKILENNYLYLFSLFLDNKGVIWIATSYGMYRYVEGKLILALDRQNASMMTYYDENHFITTGRNEIRLMNTETNENELIYRDSTISDFQASALCYDADDKKLWMGTSNRGLYHYDFDNKIIRQIKIKSFPNQFVNVICKNADSTLYIGIDGQGIWQINSEGDQLLNVYKENPDDGFSLRGNGVYDIFSDNNKRVWVCTYSGGLSFFDRTTPVVEQITHDINNVNSLNNNNVNGIIEDRSGNLWFATDNGICYYGVKTGTWQTFYNNKQKQAQVFLSICEDNHGRIWAGSYSSGVYALDEKTGSELAHYWGKDFNCNYVFDIMNDRNGDVWIGGTTGNIKRYQQEKKQFINYSNPSMYGFEEYSDTKLLLASPYGLVIFDSETGNNEVLLNGYLLHDLLYYLGEIWFGTGGDGLVRYNMSDKTKKNTLLATDCRRTT
jgi:ligand-binding sensor domain-containing protein